ncbi:MAG: dienelactone hydrolase family protein [Melioribacteraceae bacterium]|nr:dienelactone hydrolase family protein [Melioribacteraceae bacterium]
MLKLNNTIEPHKGERILYSGSDLESAKRAMILIHGRGATAESILSLSNEFNLEDTIFVAPQARDFAWYPYRFIEARAKNEPGITSGLTLINSIIAALNESGIENNSISLLGFSQGACLTIDYALRYPKKYAGVFVLSGGLIGDVINPNDYKGDLENTPIFFGCSNIDFHIPEVRVNESAEITKSLNADVTVKIYENMGHTINEDEIEIINSILLK